MAYRNLVEIACADKSELFKRMRDFICRRNGSYDYSASGIGWTLHDAVYAANENTPQANDYFVVKSTGENGKDDLYFKITFTSTGITMNGYLYWNNSTHVGVTAFYASPTEFVPLAAQAPVLWVYGDLDEVHVFIHQTTADTSAYHGCFGKTCDTMYGNVPGICSGSVSAGSSVVVAVDAIPPTLVAGRKCFIKDNAHIEFVTITSIDTGNKTITISSLSYSYTNPKIFADLCYFASGYGANSAYVAVNVQRNSVTGTLFYVISQNEINVSNPDHMNNEYVLGRYCIGNSNQGLSGYLKYLFCRGTNNPAHKSVSTFSDGSMVRNFSLAGGSSMYASVSEV